MYCVRDRTACESLIVEHPEWVICACRDPRGPQLIIAFDPEGDDEEEAAGENVCRADCVSMCRCVSAVLCVCCVFSTCVYF